MGECLPKLATIYLLLLKLLYDEKMAEVSASVNIVATLGELTAKAGEFGLIKSMTSQAEMKRALNVLKRYQLIEVMDSMEELDNQTRILIFPSINVVLMREDILKLLAVFSAEDGQEAEETTAVQLKMEAETEGEMTDGE